MSWQIQYAAVCGECDGVMGEGEWAASGTGPIRHDRCPKQPTTCTQCFLQHAGECP